MSQGSGVEETRRIAGTGNARRVRTGILVALGVVLLFLGVTGRLGVSADIELEADDAIAIALAQPQLDFTPVDSGARFMRQGVGLRPVWAVSLSIPSAEPGEDFARHMTVEIDAVSGDPLRVSVDGK